MRKDGQKARDCEPLAAGVAKYVRLSDLVDPNGHRTSFQYFPGGGEKVGIDPLLRRTSYGYDAASQRTWRLDPRGIRTTYAFDLDGRLVARKPAGEAPATFAYDPVGHRMLTHDSTGRTTSVYDAVGRVYSTRDPARKIITVTYDAAGNRSRMTDPDGGRTTYVYDAAGRIDHLVNPWGERTTWSYDPAGRPTVRRLGNGTRTSYSYDAAGQVTFITNLKSDWSVFSQVDYAYDPAGNRTRMADASSGGSGRTTWAYDATYQLTSEYRTGGTAFRITHVYDAAGNRLVRSDASGPTTYVYDAANQLQTGKTSSATTTYVYDAAGNLHVQRAPGDQRTTSTWDAENRLTRVHLPSGAITTMLYGPDGLRARKEDSGGIAKFIWDAQRLLLETDSNDVTQAMYTLAPAGFGPLVSQRRSSTSRFYHFDATDSTLGLSGADQSLTDTYVHEAYGALAASSGSTVNPFGFVGGLGYYYDSALTQYYVRARHYDPHLARWLSIDPLVFHMTKSAVDGEYPNIGRHIRALFAGSSDVDPASYGAPNSVLVAPMPRRTRQDFSRLDVFGSGLYGYADRAPNRHTDPTGLEVPEYTLGDVAYCMWYLDWIAHLGGLKYPCAAELLYRFLGHRTYEYSVCPYSCLRLLKENMSFVDLPLTDYVKSRVFCGQTREVGVSGMFAHKFGPAAGDLFYSFGGLPFHMHGTCGVTCLGRTVLNACCCECSGACQLHIITQDTYDFCDSLKVATEPRRSKAWCGCVIEDWAAQNPLDDSLPIGRPFKVNCAWLATVNVSFRKCEVWGEGLPAIV